MAVVTWVELIKMTKVFESIKRPNLQNAQGENFFCFYLGFHNNSSRSGIMI
jgi:hypothetical protein